MPEPYHQDRYGEYYSFTGHEAPHRCFWCGIEVKGQRRYCCEEHQNLYLGHFRWPEASNACQKRQCGICGDCHKKYSPSTYYTLLVVHHIIPLNGSLRLWNILNRPENLIALCPACHGKRHAELNRQKKRIEIEEHEPESNETDHRQMVMEI